MRRHLATSEMQQWFVSRAQLSAIPTDTDDQYVLVFPLENIRKGREGKKTTEAMGRNERDGVHVVEEDKQIKGDLPNPWSAGMRPKVRPIPDRLRGDPR